MQTDTQTPLVTLARAQLALALMITALLSIKSQNVPDFVDSLGPFYGAIAVPSVTRCRCRCCRRRRCRGHRCAGGVRQ